MAAKKNSAIVCCRTVSMLAIVLCHIIGYYTFVPGHGFLNEVFNVGVYSFLAISGYLYGGKTISDFRTWGWKRFQTLLVPSLLLICAVMLLELLGGKQYGFSTTVLYLLNLQGVGFVIPGVYQWFREIPTLGPLWFLSVIVLCYCMIPALQRIRTHFRSGKVTPFCMVAAVVIFLLDMLTGVSLVYFLTFFIGYALAADSSLPLSNRSFWIMTTVTFFAQGLRLLLRAICDGTPVYTSYVLVAHMVLGLWLLCVCFGFQKTFPNMADTVAQHKVTRFFDEISYYVYLTHCCFCKGSWNLYQCLDNLVLATFAFVAATLGAAVLLKYISGRINRILNTHNCFSV